jgi:hypothetical protein
MERMIQKSWEHAGSGGDQRIKAAAYFAGSSVCSQFGFGLGRIKGRESREEKVDFQLLWFASCISEYSSPLAFCLVKCS